MRDVTKNNITDVLLQIFPECGSADTPPPLPPLSN
jgi:hypothetical protein